MVLYFLSSFRSTLYCVISSLNCWIASFPSLVQEEHNPSRRKCLACLCTVTLISVTGPTICTPNGLAADMNKPGTQKAVCRNCNGSGAIICKGFAALLSFVCALLMLNASTVLVAMDKQGVLLFFFVNKKQSMFLETDILNQQVSCLELLKTVCMLEMFIS
jgi:hypothetical protein